MAKAGREIRPGGAVCFFVRANLGILCMLVLGLVKRQGSLMSELLGRGRIVRFR